MPMKLRNKKKAFAAMALVALATPQATAIAEVPIDEQDRTYDVAVVGAGPAGLSTAVYAASEGLSVTVFDARAFGGQSNLPDDREL